VKILCFFSLKKQRLKRKAGNAFFKNAKTFGSKKIASSYLLAMTLYDSKLLKMMVQMFGIQQIPIEFFHHAEYGVFSFGSWVFFKKFFEIVERQQ
jgi:hypothetical protein